MQVCQYYQKLALSKPPNFRKTERNSDECLHIFSYVWNSRIKMKLAVCKISKDIENKITWKDWGTYHYTSIYIYNY